MQYAHELTGVLDASANTLQGGHLILAAQSNRLDHEIHEVNSSSYELECYGTAALELGAHSGDSFLRM